MIKTTLFACAAIAAAACLPTASQAAPKTFAYLVTVKTSFGTQFQDCFVFKGEKLTVAGYGELIFAPAPTMEKHFYTAVSPIASAQAAGFAIAFAGYHTGNDTAGAIHAVGSNELHNSYTVNGKINASCVGAAASQPGLYRPAQ